MAPALVLLGTFVVWPLLRTVQLSGYASDLLGNPSRFVGLGNYAALAGDSAFTHTVAVSIALAVAGTALAVGGALCAAVMLRTRLPGSRIFAVVFSLPFAYSAASASAVFAGLFAPTVGSVNTLLAEVGINGPAWLSQPLAAFWAVAISTAWYEFGFAFLVLTAAVGALPAEVVEAAQLDGAGGLRLAVCVVVPLVRPSLLFLTVTQMITGLQTFAQVQILTRGGPAGSTTTFVFRLYELAFGNGTPDFGRASSVAVVLLVLVVAVTAAQFGLLTRGRT